MNKNNEKWIIIIIAVVVIIISSINFNNIIHNNYVLEKKKDYYKDENWFIPKDLSTTKQKNCFSDYDLMNLNSLKYELASTSNTHKFLGSNSIIIENKHMEMYFKKNISVDCLIFFCKALDTTSVEKNKLDISYFFNKKLKRATHIIYGFGINNWKHTNKWVLKKYENNGLDRFYAPEDNSLIIFNRDEEYEWINLKSDTPFYFMTIILFE